MAAGKLFSSIILMERDEDDVYGIIYTENAKQAKAMMLNTKNYYLYDYEENYNNNEDHEILYLKDFDTHTTTKIELLRTFDYDSMDFTIDAIIIGMQ